MRRLAAIALALMAAACAQTDPAAEAERQWDACQEFTPVPAVRITACSAVIDDPAASAERRVAALVERGAMRVMLGQHARALADFGRALRIDPDNTQALIERGVLHREAGDFAAALSAFDAALELDSDLQAARAQRQTTLELRAAAWRAQLEQLDQAIARTPNDPALLNQRCWILAISGGDLESALAACNASLKADPEYAPALDSRGLVHLKRGEFEAALADYESALTLQPGRGHFLYGRGLARLVLSRGAEGDADLAAAERSEPGIGEAYRGYGVSVTRRTIPSPAPSPLQTSPP